MALNITFEVISPSLALALTNGVVQPEYTGFMPAGASEMVDLFTGDFKYNIPLMEVDGYPLNLSYQAGTNMETEASWVGLGWSLNPGVLNRMVKGLPDDFKGEEVVSETHMKPHSAMGIGAQASTWLGVNVSFEAVGAGASIGANAGVVLTYNNYKGFGVETQLDCNTSLSANVGPASVFVAGGVGVSMSSQDGGTLSYQHSKGFGLGVYSSSIGEGTSINTRSGAMTSTYFGNQSLSYGGVSIGKTTSHTIPTGAVSYSPRIPFDYRTKGFGLAAKVGLWGCAQVPIPPVNIRLEGGTLFGLNGFYNKTDIADNTKQSKAYGYMYLEKADEDALLDFNRFRDGAITEEVPNGPLANKTYDNYAATAQGMAANFRPFRSDIGVVYDAANVSKGYNIPVSGEFSALLFMHMVEDYLYSSQDGRSGNWNTLINNNLKFQDRDITLAADRFVEKCYFKSFGEQTARNAAYDASLGGENLVSPALTPIADGYEAEMQGMTGLSRKSRDIRATNIGYLTAQQADQYGYERNYYLYDKDPSDQDVDPLNRMVMPESGPISRLTKSVPGNSGYSVGHHLSEVTVTSTSGSRYVYGIPAYNLYKKRIMFNASNRREDSYNPNGYPTTNYTDDPLKRSNTHQLVEYNPNADMNTNLRGSDNLYQAEETPAYANYYLLTTILSTDYVDVTQNGPSYDDLGQFTKFNYSKTGEYGWRDPYGVPGFATDGTSSSGTRGTITSNVVNQANLDKGLIADELDDKGFFEYGVRENYYMQSIETKNYVAFFECSQREDYQGVDDQHGSPSATQPNYKLDKIKLYSKSEIIAKGKAQAVPLKVVHFVYNYSLCPKTFNSQASTTHGKLTLEKVYFTYGTSEKAAFSPYEFFYGDNDHDGTTDTFGNPEYNNKATDRWGNYKPNLATGPSGDETPDIGAPGGLNNIEFPYAEQNEDLANAYAVAWNLTRIVTPSSAIIDVTYEADDYGYVQNETAGQMLMVHNTAEYIDPIDNVSSYATNTSIGQTNYLIVDLSKLNTGIEASLPTILADRLARKNLFRPGSDLYYKCFLKLAGPPNSFGLDKDYYDFVPGYAQVLNAGLFTSSIGANTYVKDGVTYYRYAYVQLKKELAYDTREVNPITLAGWDYLRSFLPRIAYPGSEPANMGDDSHKPKKQLKNMLVGLGVALADFVNGVSGNPNKRFYNKKFCDRMDYDKSFVRAFVPYKRKKGGGYRVKQLMTQDAWNSMTNNTGTGYSEAGSVFGQAFDYTTLDTDNKTSISSGVALYEPIQGGDEISLRKPVKFTIEKKMAPNDHLFQEEPLGEMLYPAPLVGYSKVTVTPLADPTVSNLYKIGKSVFEFYTAKDYPIITSHSELTKEIYQNDLVESFTVVEKAFKVMYATQGHVLKFNDMHGKQKAVTTYGQDNIKVPISGMKYSYKDAAWRGGRQLVTSARTISDLNVIAVEQIARDIDVTVDNRANTNISITNGKSFLTEASACEPPLRISETEVEGNVEFGLKTSVVTKIVQQYGILEKVEIFDDKSRTLTENLMWDRNSGEVVLTKVTDPQNQTEYHYNYPAYWMHQRMGGECRREGLMLKILADGTTPAPIWNRTTGALAKSTLTNPLLLTPGDEVVIYKNDLTTPILGGKRYWVTYDYSNTTLLDYCFVDREGVLLNTSTESALSTGDVHYIKVVRSADRNQFDASAGQVTSLAIPALSGSSFLVNTKILNSSAQTWCQGWNAYLDNAGSAQSASCLYPGFATVPASGTTRYNPYTSGSMGNWRPERNFEYDVTRDYSGTQLNVNNDGTFLSYGAYWAHAGSGVWSKNPAWIQMNRNSTYSPYGYLMENVDAIGLYHACRYGFNHELPILTASNARVREVGFESFEDYHYYQQAMGPCNFLGNDQLDFYGQVVLSGSAKPLVTNAAAHTGRTSLHFNTGQSLTLTHFVNKTNEVYPPAGTDGWSHHLYDVCSDDHALNRLAFNPGKYLVSFWVRNPTPALSYTSDIALAIQTQDGSTIAAVSTALKQSPVVNGWQKLDYTFTIPSSPGFGANSTIRFSLTASNSVYIDDFRVQPYNSKMTCTVYDPLQMRVWAQLDDENFATLMEYDNEGSLVRRKRETVKGLFTLQETRSANAKRN